jgi:probable F420-dependent oxidoreductase
VTVARPPTLTVGLPNFGSLFAPGEWHRFVDLGRAADDAGVDRVVLVDHVVMGADTDAYVWGRFPVPPEAPWLEPLTVLAAIAAVTERVRLATGILVAPLRPAPLLAKAVATLDVVSRGRVDLGVGTGWQRAEYDAVGLDFAQRGQLLTDTLGALRVLWRDAPATYDSPTVSFRDVTCEPRPLQRVGAGGVPIWVAGTLHARNLARVVEHGDGWIPIMGATLEQIAAGAVAVRGALREAGRDATRFQVQAPLRLARGEDGRPDLARSLESVPDLVAAGATDVHVPLQAFCRDPEAAPTCLRDLAERFTRSWRA